MEGFQQENNEVKKSKIEEIPYKDILHARNDAQFKLASRHLGFDVGNEAFEQWREEHGDKFGDIVKEHPEFLERYFHGDQSDVLDEISELLYEKHGVER